jgi:Ca2+-binding RTX toxin-like protein
MPVLGFEFPINTTDGDEQLNSTQTVLADGRILVTWISTENLSDDRWNVRGRFLDADGTPIGSDFLVNTVPLGDSNEAPTVVALPNGDAFVSWQSFSRETFVSEVRGSIVSASGGSSPDFVINSSLAVSPGMPSAALMADGRIFIAYDSSEGEPRYPGEIRGRILNADGTPATEYDFVINGSWGNQFDPDVTALSDGRVFVTWVSYDLAEEGHNISGRFLNSDGSSDGLEFRVAAISPREQFSAVTTVLADGRIMVAWMGQEADGDQNIHARILNADGSVAVSDIVVNSILADWQVEPTITALPDGRALVAWRGPNPDIGSPEIYGRIVNADGTTPEPDFLVNTRPAEEESAPYVVTLPDGRVVASWTSFNPITNDGDIHGALMAFNPITTGTDGNDQIGGTMDNDIIRGLGGNDVVYGGNGNDVLRGDGGNDLLFGEAGNDFLFGGDGNDRLWGGDGTDIFEGGNGADVFAGGRGLDTVRYQTSLSGVRVDLSLNTASGGEAEGDSFSSIETVIGSRFADTLIGDAAANTLSGGMGRDSLDGRDGNDTLDGGEGNDAIIGGNGDDILRGGAGDDQIWGNAGNDILAGGAGADVLAGGAGIDTADYSASGGGVSIDLAQLLAQWGDAEHDTLNSIENVTGTASGDVLIGSAGSNRLAGGGHNDWLTGGGGADDLLGGIGTDTFIYTALTDSSLTATDRILDFSSTEVDQINLSQIDASNQLDGDQAFVFVGDAAFSHAAGELRFDDHLLQGDVNGDGLADFQINVNVAALTNADLIV